MKKSAFSAVLVLIATALSACPIYDDDATCSGSLDCDDGYVCDDFSDSCIPAYASCVYPSDCGTNETCSRSGICVAGDCHYSSVGCVDGFVCSSSSGRWECLREDTSEGGSGQGSSHDADTAGAGGTL